MADTYNEPAFLDLILPANNKGKKAIALVLWALAREVMSRREQPFEAKTEDFGGGE
jgi:small subunit ribosomal protein S2